MAEMPSVVPGEIATSDWGNKIRDRSLQRYTTAADRDLKNPTPVNGDLAFLSDSGSQMVYASTTWWNVGGATTITILRDDSAGRVAYSVSGRLVTVFIKYESIAGQDLATMPVGLRPVNGDLWVTAAWRDNVGTVIETKTGQVLIRASGSVFRLSPVTLPANEQLYCTITYVAGAEGG